MDVWAKVNDLWVMARSFHGWGGPLHIVWDDFNIEDGFIQWCVDNMDEHYSQWHDYCEAPTEKVCRAVMEELARHIAMIPLEQREDFLRLQPV